MHYEFEKITDTLLINGYPLPFIQTQIGDYLNQKYSNPTPSKNNVNHIPGIILKLPFMGNPSIKLKNELKSFFRRNFYKKVNLKAVCT